MQNNRGPLTLPHTVTLEYPVQLGKDEKNLITEIVFPRRLRTRDLMGIADTMPNVDRTVKIASRLTGQVSHVFEEMDPVDLQKISEVIEGFLPSSPQTGASA